MTKGRGNGGRAGARNANQISEAINGHFPDEYRHDIEKFTANTNFKRTELSLTTYDGAGMKDQFGESNASQRQFKRGNIFRNGNALIV